MTKLEKFLYEDKFKAWKKTNRGSVMRGNAIAKFLGETDNQVLEDLIFEIFYKSLPINKELK